MRWYNKALGLALALGLSTAGAQTLGPPGGGGGGSPTGAAGGSLTGTYPNPGLNVGGTTIGTLPAANGGTGEAGTVTGALKGNGTSPVTQAACADLSNGTTLCSTTPGANVATALAIAVGTTGGFAVQTTGTWIPVPTNLTVVGTPTYTGAYIKTGHQVHVEMTVIATTSTASVAGNTAFAGLPFAAVGANGSGIAACAGSINGNLTSYGLGQVNSSSLFTPTWSATGNTIFTTCDYQTAS